VAGVFVAIPALFMNLTEVTDLCSIGTLFAFVLVSGGVLVLDERKKGQSPPRHPNEFRIPYLNSRYFLPVAWAVVFGIWWFATGNQASGDQIVTSHISHLTSYVSRFTSHDFPIMLFALVAIIISVIGIRKQLSLIPVLGLLTNLYLMAQLGSTNWLRFLVWLVVGLVIYFTFGIRHSKLRGTKDDRRRMN
jgi:hypothetical protein